MTTASIQAIRDDLQQGREALLKRRATARPVKEWLAEHSALIDETLRRIYQAAWEAARAALGPGQVAPEHEHGLALLAIGGYGRGELCPHSDIDIAFVPSEEEHPVIDAVVKEAFRLIVEVFSDGARLDVAYAYRPLADIAWLEHTGKTALLEARRIAGSDRILRRVHEELHNSWDATEFILEKVRERREAARHPNMSLYAVEPNLKEGMGGLRDIHSAIWVSSATLRTEAPLRELEWRGVVTADDCTDIEKAREFLLKVRVWLHLTTQKKNDVLRAELQDRCARALGYTGTGARAAQALLADFYRHGEAAARFSVKVMRRLLEGPLALDQHFVATHQRLHAAHPYTLRNHPELLLAPFAQSRKYGFPMSPELQRGVEEALPFASQTTLEHPIARAGFFTLVHDVEGAADALSELRAHGVLQRLMPEFGAMLHLAPADPSHELTVGEHSIAAVRQLGHLWSRQREDDELHAVCGGIDDVELLVLGTLLHDVGKIEPGTDHSVSGEEIARRIGTRLGLSGSRIERLALLVRRHLALPRGARLRDLSSPGTILSVVSHVSDVATLKMLYLLSLADTCAVGERTYSAHDLEAMRELYERALIAMTSEETAEVLTDSEKREQMIQRERERLRRQMRHLELDEETLHRLCDTLPAAYVLNTPLATISHHVRLLDQLPEEELILDFADEPHAEFTEMTVVTYDDEKPGLLSKICGVVHAANADIFNAHVYTLLAQDGTGGAPQGRDIVLDRLHLMANGRALSGSRRARLAVSLREVLLGQKSVEDVLAEAGKEAAASIMPQRIAARNDLSDEHTVITVVCDNIPGLLYYVTHAIAEVGLDIHTAKITSWAGRAEDAFYVTRRGEGGNAGEKISDDDIRDTLEALREQLTRPGRKAMVDEMQS